MFGFCALRFLHLRFEPAKTRLFAEGHLVPGFEGKAMDQIESGNYRAKWYRNLARQTSFSRCARCSEGRLE